MLPISDRVQPADEDQSYDWSWFLRGAKNLFSLPALILLLAFVGFGGLAREADLPLEHLIFLVPTIWALPSHLILLAGIVSGASVLAIAVAVGLAAIRMMPMTMALVPEIRASNTKRWHLLLVCNLVAITAWVHTMQKAREIPRNGRIPYFAGFASTLVAATTIAAALVHLLAPSLPPVIMACSYFLTPIYFATSIWNTARVRAEHYALGIGFVLGPIATWLLPQASILIAGVTAGVTAYGLHRLSLSKLRQS